jgi:Spy/CpxP family protein refolding chaperone
MKTLAWLGCAVAAILLASPVAFGEDKQPETKPAKAPKAAKAEDADKATKEKSPLKGEYAIMASVLKMDDAQKAKLVEACEAGRLAVQQWEQSEDGKKLEKLTAELAEARKGDDKAKTGQLQKEVAELRKKAPKPSPETKQKVAALLTDEQKLTWAAFTSERLVLRKLTKIELTDDQTKQLKGICLEAVKAVPAGDEKARAEANKKIFRDVEEKVLTDAQREAVKKPAHEKAEKPAKPKAEGDAEK